MPPELSIGKRLLQDVLEPMKRSFIGKDEVIDLMGLCLVAGENLFVLGPPGTAKSALVYDLGRRLDGTTFEYLLTRFTEPNELFGPFDIRKLREGTLETNVEGMLPEADLVFLDELLNANSAILNSLLTVLNERKLRRGREILRLPLLMTVGASNHLPEEEALRALFDRFLLRVVSDNVPDESLEAVLDAGWKMETADRDGNGVGVTAREIRELRSLLPQVSLAPVRSSYLGLIRRLRLVGIDISDRRAVKLQRLIAASALLCGRMSGAISDLWILRFIWDVEEQREMLDAAVNEVLDGAGEGSLPAHPRSDSGQKVDADQLRRDLEGLDLAHTAAGDRLRLLETRIGWVENEESRRFLEERIAEKWTELKGIGEEIAG